MFIVFQFPFSDIRVLHGAPAAKRLAVPDWNVRNSRRVFLRGFGRARERRNRLTEKQRNFLKSWKDETRYVDARRAVRLTGFSPAGVAGVRMTPAFKKLFFDGKMTGRVEIAFFAEPQSGACFHRSLIREIFKYILNLDVTSYAVDFSGGGAEKARCEPKRARLSQIPETMVKYYLASTLPFRGEDGVPVSARECYPLVQAGNPVIIAALDYGESLDGHESGGAARAEDANGWIYQRVDSCGEPVGTFLLPQIIRKRGGYNHQLTRRMLSRIHTDYQGVELAVRLLKRNKIVFAPISAGSDFFQSYVKEATRRITRGLDAINRETSPEAKYVRDTGDTEPLKELLSELRTMDQRIARDFVKQTSRRSVSGNFEKMLDRVGRSEENAMENGNPPNASNITYNFNTYGPVNGPVGHFQNSTVEQTFTINSFEELRKKLLAGNISEQGIAELEPLLVAAPVPKDEATFLAKAKTWLLKYTNDVSKASIVALISSYMKTL